jgi:hypothetical protein
MIPFRYSGFWDVPRFVHLNYRGRSLLLLSVFDEAVDEYPDHYTVFEVPEDVVGGSELKWWWDGGGEGRGDFVAIGTVAISDVQFDETKRKLLAPSFLDGILPPGHQK